MELFSRMQTIDLQNFVHFYGTVNRDEFLKLDTQCEIGFFCVQAS